MKRIFYCPAGIINIEFSKLINDAVQQVFSYLFIAHILFSNPIAFWVPK